MEFSCDPELNGTNYTAIKVNSILNENTSIALTTYYKYPTGSKLFVEISGSGTVGSYTPPLKVEVLYYQISISSGEVKYV